MFWNMHRPDLLLKIRNLHKLRTWRLVPLVSRIYKTSWWLTTWAKERFRCHREAWPDRRRNVCPEPCLDAAVASGGERKALGLLCYHKLLKLG